MSVTAHPRNILITGGTGGLGKQSARTLLEKGHHLIIVGRNVEKGEKVVDELSGLGGEVTFMPADLSLQSDIRALAAAVSDKWDHLDVLINNVGHIFTDRKVTEDGIEVSLALNHMCAYLLTSLLMPLLEAAEAGRIVNVSSGMHHFGKINLHDLQFEKNYFGWFAYGNAKLANVTWSHQLARDLQDTGITVNVADPFMALSENHNDLLGVFGNWAQPALWPYKQWLKTVMPMDQSAWPIVHLAISSKVEGMTGHCLTPARTFVRSSTISYSRRLARRVLAFSEELVREPEPA